MDDINIQQVLSSAVNWINTEIFVTSTIIQISVILGSIIIIIYPAVKTKNILKNLLAKLNISRKNTVENSIDIMTTPLMINILLWVYTVLAINLHWPYLIIQVTAQILSAWILIRFMLSFLENKLIISMVTFAILSIITLNLLNIYDTTVKLLNNLSFTLGELKVSVWLILQGFFLFTIILWLSRKIASLLEKKIKNINDLTPSLQVLLNKMSKIILYTAAGFFGLSILGIDLTALTVLGGAVGVGIGFGLQKIVANFISGIIILADKSIKPGDVIQVGGTFGWVDSLNARFVSIITLDGEEYLIPNEDFIVEKVVNLSYSDEYVRIKVPIGISYDSDVKKAMTLVEEATLDVDRIDRLHQPKCHLIGFGDSSIDLELRFWIRDPKNGLAGVKTDVLLNIWEAFKEEDIEIPYPQRDLHLRTTNENNKNSFQEVMEQE
ncbi:MAG: mechanosensitive ion channel family protein [Halothermotrichaceae bacterium]